jgi:two-component system response regulator HydG
VTGAGERLRALLEEARASGELAGLAGDLEDALLAARAARVNALEQAGDVPVRYGMIGDSAGMLRVFGLIERLAVSDVPVLVFGETGTGKELVARALHAESRRGDGPFLAENCAAVPANLLESELFGHKRGAFTDAVADRDGHFVAASGGTLFLDEIGDMPLDMQAKLLRVLESSEVRPVGSNKTVKVDVRLVAATHRDLTAMVQERAFREDLLYRLNVVRIDLPPLRERNGDVPHLVRYFLERAAEADAAEHPGMTPEALAALAAFSWPGNVRQLENEMRRATALTPGTIDVSDLAPEIQAGGAA